MMRIKSGTDNRAGRLVRLAVTALVGIVVSSPLMAHQGHKHPASGKTAAATNTTPAQTPPAPAHWDAANVRIPDVAVRDQFGESRAFNRDLIKGRKVLVNFVFTSCTSVCSPMTATFKAVQDELTRRKIDDVQLISVSVDPLNDTPQVLRQYAKKFDVGPGWTFVTGSRKSIDEILRAFGVSIADFNDHPPMAYVGDDSRGKWTRVSGIASVESIVSRVAEPQRAAEAPSALKAVVTAPNERVAAAVR